MFKPTVISYISTFEAETYPGIYDVPEAALYVGATLSSSTPLNISSQKLIRWIRHGLSSRELVGIPGKEPLITFKDLVSMRVIATLRGAGVSFKKIYAAEDLLRAMTGHPRPFATEVLWTAQS